ncbi:hypothetical protein VNI00_016230 [Paramarasmius palmivorus]|uniref:Uncharacterized protein n=1 Tax=Paramarasmius palmivorus TaxID=297713 RepID=A0AAW0BEP6_9AGAR
MAQSMLLDAGIILSLASDQTTRNIPAASTFEKHGRSNISAQRCFSHHSSLLPTPPSIEAHTFATTPNTAYVTWLVVLALSSVYLVVVRWSGYSGRLGRILFGLVWVWAEGCVEEWNQIIIHATHPILHHIPSSGRHPTSPFSPHPLILYLG